MNQPWIQALVLGPLITTAACIDVDSNWTFGGGPGAGGAGAGGAGVGGGARTYADLVLEDEPLAYWRLGEAAGPVVADETLNFEAVAVPQNGAIDWGIPGAIMNDNDTSLRLAGGARITLNAAIAPVTLGFLGRDPYTLEGWVQPTDGIVHMLTSSDFIGDPGYSTEMGSGFATVEHIRKGARTDASTPWPRPTVSDGFHHVAVTYDGTYAQLYFDGAPTAAEPTLMAIDLSDPGVPYIVALAGSSESASFDELAVYDHVLPIQRIVAHYECGAHGTCE